MATVDHFMIATGTLNVQNIFLINCDQFKLYDENSKLFNYCCCNLRLLRCATNFPAKKNGSMNFA